MAKIHATAVVADGAQLDDSVEVGPLCVIGPNVKIGAGTKLIAQCHIGGHTTIGENNTFYPFSAVGRGRIFMRMKSWSLLSESVTTISSVKVQQFTVVLRRTPRPLSATAVCL